ncbi:unnamed protein product [Peronospora destructor]|uniref:Uncharacterized protein n=1 Tax=Peronospora destructor TaxID=86335 RepID=A0AAV0UXL3_9STRA|nr:unnamed protein product [Peronospora destructor]
MSPLLVDNRTQTLLFFRLAYRITNWIEVPDYQEETMGKGSGGGSKGGGSGSSGSGTKGIGGAAPTKASTDNRSNQLNPNNPTYIPRHARRDREH